MLYKTLIYLLQLSRTWGTTLDTFLQKKILNEWIMKSVPGIIWALTGMDLVPSESVGPRSVLEAGIKAVEIVVWEFMQKCTAVLLLYTNYFLVLNFHLLLNKKKSLFPSFSFSKQTESCCWLQHSCQWTTGLGIFFTRGTFRDASNFWWGKHFLSYLQPSSFYLSIGLYIYIYISI